MKKHRNSLSYIVIFLASSFEVNDNSIPIFKCLNLGPVYMEKSCLGYPRQPSPGDNFTERLYDKKLARLTEIKLTLLNYSEILL